MPSLKKIRATMEKQKINDEIMAQMDFEADCNDPLNIIGNLRKPLIVTPKYAKITV